MPSVLVTLPPVHGGYQARRRGGEPTSGTHPHRYAPKPQETFVTTFSANFREPPRHEVPRITFPRTRVNWTLPCARSGMRPHRRLSSIFPANGVFIRPVYPIGTLLSIKTATEALRTHPRGS